jgi:hypothetical protein
MYRIPSVKTRRTLTVLAAAAAAHLVSQAVFVGDTKEQGDLFCLVGPYGSSESVQLFVVGKKF